jgi:hypothetical protein
MQRHRLPRRVPARERAAGARGLLEPLTVLLLLLLRRRRRRPRVLPVVSAATWTEACWGTMPRGAAAAAVRQQPGLAQGRRGWPELAREVQQGQQGQQAQQALQASRAPQGQRAWVRLLRPVTPSGVSWHRGPPESWVPQQA